MEHLRQLSIFMAQVEGDGLEKVGRLRFGVGSEIARHSGGPNLKKVIQEMSLRKTDKRLFSNNSVR
jgi:hypothetical protein